MILTNFIQNSLWEISKRENSCISIVKMIIIEIGIRIITMIAPIITTIIIKITIKFVITSIMTRPIVTKMILFLMKKIMRFLTRYSRNTKAHLSDPKWKKQLNLRIWKNNNYGRNSNRIRDILCLLPVRIQNLTSRRIMRKPINILRGMHITMIDITK